MWCNATASFAKLSCPLLNKTVIEPNEIRRFRCDMHGQPNQIRRFLPSAPALCTGSAESFHAHHPRAFERPNIPTNGTIFFVGDSLAQQAARAFTCRLWEFRSQRAGRHHNTHHSTTANGAHDDLLEVPAAASSWYDIVNPRSRPHRERGAPWCVRFQAVDRLRICFVTAYPSVLGTASVLIQGSIARSGDAIVVNENMAHGEEAALVSMRRFATAATNATFRMAGVKLFWREKSPQAFSDSPRGSFQHATYGSRGQHCAVPADRSRSKAVHEGLQTLAAAGVGVVRIWDQTVTQADQYLASRTPYVASKLDCTHFCEPSGVLDEWSDAMLRALQAHTHHAMLGGAQ